MALTKKCRHTRAGKRPAECECAWYADLYVNGRRTFQPLGRLTPAEAKAAYAQAVADNLAGRLTPSPRGAGMAEVAERWLAERERSGVRPATMKNCRSHIGAIERWFGDVHPRRVRSADLAEFLSAFAMTPRPATGRPPARDYVANIGRSLRQILDLARDEGLIETVPELPRERGRMGRRAPAPQHLTFAEVERVIAAMPAKYRDAAELSYLTGLRVGEVLALRAEHFDAERRALRVEGTLHAKGHTGPPKTRTSARRVGLSARAVELLAARVNTAEPGERLFPYSYDAARDAFRDTLEALDLYEPGRGWHELRHANTALRNASGQSLRDAAASLGHGPNFSQSLAYGWQSEAAGADELDAAREQVRRRRTN